MKRNNVKLYNVIFPIWFMIAIPTPLWFIVVPINLIIDFIVTYFSMKKCGVTDSQQKAEKSIFKVCCFGFLSDFIGAIFLTVLGFDNPDNYPKYRWLLENISKAFYNPFANVYSFVYTMVCVVFAGWLIYIFNKNFSFADCDMTPSQIKYVSLSLAVVTAPYLFLVPTTLFY